MVCVQCGQKTVVTNSRAQRRVNQVWRRRRCLACGAVFTTEELADYQGSWRVHGRAGHLEPFSRDRLFLSIYEAVRHRPTATADAGALTATIMAKLGAQVKDGVVAAAAIARTAQVALNRFDGAASVAYQAFHGA